MEASGAPTFRFPGLGSVDDASGGGGGGTGKEEDKGGVPSSTPSTSITSSSTSGSSLTCWSFGRGWRAPFIPFAVFFECDAEVETEEVDTEAEGREEAEERTE